MKINRIKLLYHGTDQSFNIFDFSRARAFKDFGKGFYLTSSVRQAQKWAENKAKNKNEAYIYSYKVCKLEQEEWNVLELLRYDKEWLDFITKSRIDGMETGHDIVYDRIADNQYTEISEVLNKYSNNQISEARAIERIKMNDYQADQYCFKNERSLKLLRDRKIITLYRDNKIWKQQKG